MSQTQTPQIVRSGGIGNSKSIPAHMSYSLMVNTLLSKISMSRQEVPLEIIID